MNEKNVLVWLDSDGNITKIKNDVITDDVINIDSDFVVVDINDDDWE